jgi:hypothetical protein
MWVRLGCPIELLRNFVDKIDSLCFGFADRDLLVCVPNSSCQAVTVYLPGASPVKLKLPLLSVIARQRLGALTKQGSPLRFLWNEAAAHAVRGDPELQRFYRRKLVQKGLGKARVAAARKLGIRLWIMLRDQIDYQEFCRRGQRHSGAACAGMLEVGNGANRHRPVD